MIKLTDELVSDIAAISSTQPADCHLYALLDSSIYASAQPPQWNGRVSSLAQRFYPAEHWDVFSYAFDEQGNEASPLLFPLRRLDSDLSREIAAHAMLYPLCSWLWSPLQAEDLAKHLASFIRAEIGGTAAILRPYDPRLIEDVIACFDEDRRQRMLSGIAHWVYLDGGEVLKTVGGTEPIFRGVDGEGPMQLTAEEQDRFEHLANRIALESYIDEHAEGVFEGLTPSERKGFCEQQLSFGKKLGMESMGDLLIIGVMTQRHGNAWMNAPQIVHILNAVKAKKMDLRLAMRDIDAQLSDLSKKSEI